MGKYVTITEIARQLNVSHSTVSRALNGHARISEKTRRQVVELAERLGYQSNSTAHRLSKGESGIIGVIVPDLSIHFFTKVIAGIQAVLQQAGCEIMLFNTVESMEQEVRAIEQCLKYRVDGVLAAISMKTNTFGHFQKLLRYEVPLVFFDRVANFLPVPKVVADDYQASRNATHYLINSGCRCIAHITASINLNNSNNRLYGYMDALKEAGMPVKEALIHYYEFDRESIALFLERTLKQHPGLDGLFVFNDYVANYSVNVLQKLGKQIPTDISVIGFSDEPVATYMTPQLSTVQHEGEKMGGLAAHKLISIIKKNEPADGEKILINPKLVLRGTTR